MTNFEKIKNMTIDEFTEIFDFIDCRCCPYCKKQCEYISCKDVLKEWLESEVKE